MIDFISPLLREADSMRTLSLRSLIFGRRLLGALMLALACVALPLAAAELVGTPVEPGASAPVAPPAPLDPAALAAEQAQASAGLAEASAALANQAAQAAQAEAQAQQVQAQVQEQWQRELERNFGGGEERGFDYSQLVPITAIIFIFGGPIFLFAFWIAHSYRARARRQQDINNNIDKLLAAGRDIPIELLRGDEPKLADENDNLASGIRNTFLGIGLLIFLTALVGFDVGALGFILIALGLSRLCVWYLSKPKAGAQPADAQQQAGSQD